MHVAVRRAAVADAALIASLNADVQAIHAAVLPVRFKPPSADGFLAEASALLAKPETLAFVAEAASGPAGYALAEVIRRPETSLVHAHEMIMVNHLSVRPQLRRCGVGSALIAAARAAGSELGITLVALDVWTFNDDARAFFRRQGFVPYIERLWDRAG